MTPARDTFSDLRSSNSSIKLSGANVYFGYSYRGGYSAALRSSRLSISYGLDAEESNARAVRAFYPHRRNQGTFSVQLDLNGWDEYRAVMSWFKSYEVLILGTTTPPPMAVSMPVRGFARYGIPTSGVEFGDHTASMVFSPTINFLSVSDPNDAKTAILKAGQISQETNAHADPTARNYFYPDSAVNYPGKLQDALYTTAPPPVTQATIGGDTGPSSNAAEHDGQTGANSPIVTQIGSGG